METLAAEPATGSKNLDSVGALLFAQYHLTISGIRLAAIPHERIDSYTGSNGDCGRLFAQARVHGAFELVEHQGHRHTTPWGAVQSFQFSVLRRR